MSFPANPSNGQAAIVNKITYQYSSATNTWTKLTSLPTYLANLTANSSITIGNLTMNGNLTNITAAGNLYIGGTGVFGTALNYVPANAPVQVGFNINNYSQFSIQNANTGNNASTDIAAIANNGSDNDTYVDMGIVGSGYSQASYNLYNPNDGYLIVSGNTITRGGNLILNTYQANDIIFATGGTQKNNEVMRVTSANVVNIKSTNTSTSTTTGALIVAGGAGIAGNLNVGGNLTTTGNTVHTGNLTVSGAGNKLYFADGSSQSTAATAGLAGVFGQAFTTTGSGQTFTIPSGVTAIKATVIGGGGAGGSQGGNYGSAGGGGAGGLAISYLTGLTPGNTLSVTVGAAASTSSVASGTQSISTITATGGGSGGVGTGNGGGSGGAGGAASGGTINCTGGAGVSAAGSTGIIFVSGSGANSIFGGGGTSSANNGTNGGAAGAFGAGGGGGNGYGASGGAGYQGVVIFEW